MFNIENMTPGAVFCVKTIEPDSKKEPQYRNWVLDSMKPVYNAHKVTATCVVSDDRLEAYVLDDGRLSKWTKINDNFTPVRHESMIDTIYELEV